MSLKLAAAELLRATPLDWAAAPIEREIPRSPEAISAIPGLLPELTSRVAENVPQALGVWIATSVLVAAVCPDCGAIVRVSTRRQL